MKSAPRSGGQSAAGTVNSSHANDLSRVLIRTLARTDLRVRGLAHGLALQRIDATSTDVDLSLDLAKAVADLHIHAIRLPSAIGVPRALQARASYLTQGLEYASESACELARQLGRTHPRGGAQARRIARACDEAASLLREFTTVLHLEEAAASSRVPGRVSRPAQWLIGSAARILPAVDRPRYAEEWRSELWDLATEPRRRHIAHALRITAYAWATRRAILSDPRDGGGEG